MSDGQRAVIGRPGPGEDGRKAILDAAAKAFASRGYLATSIDAIATTTVGRPRSSWTSS
jgi:AcrR family transcriptional regulator